jgi:hypothetical protein
MTIELVATTVVIASSVLLFAYWFRYTCMLILSAKTTRDYAGDVAAANQLAFLEVQNQLRTGHRSDLGRLRSSLDRDYAVITYLLEHAASPSKQVSAIENQMLAINYRLMGAWFSISRRFSTSAACRALNEMAGVVAHFANAMGERAACGAAA